MAFIATLSYELTKETADEARKLLRAELVGRRYFDRYEGKRLPEGTVWARKPDGEGVTVVSLKEECARDLRAAIVAVAEMGRTIRLARAWVQVTGAGTYGLIEP